MSYLYALTKDSRTVQAGLLVGILSTLSSTALGQQEVARVSVSPVVEQRDAAAGQVFVGTVKPARRSIVGSAVDGRVVEFLVQEGDRVEKDQALARLLTRALEIQIAGAEAQRDLRRHELTELENGSRVEEIRSAEGRMLAAKAAMEYAESKLKRTQTLVEHNAVSRDELQDDIQLALTTTSLHTSAKAEYDLAVAGPRKEKIEQARAQLAVAEERINQLRDQLEKHTIVAPFAGYIVAEYTEVGQWISAGQHVAEVIDIDRVDVEAQVLESYLPELRLGTAGRVEISALPKEVFSGRVSAIVPRADERSRSFPVKMELVNRMLDDGSPLLKPGMFARVWLPVEPKKTTVLLVSKDALVLGGPEPLVYVVEPDASDARQGRARAVAVTLGVAVGGMVEVRGSLAVGQQVVVEGNERLRPDQQVVVARVVEPEKDARPPAVLPRQPSGDLPQPVSAASGQQEK